jgi:hypothetical protein
MSHVHPHRFDGLLAATCFATLLLAIAAGPGAATPPSNWTLTSANHLSLRLPSSWRVVDTSSLGGLTLLLAPPGRASFCLGQILPPQAWDFRTLNIMLGPAGPGALERIDGQAAKEFHIGQPAISVTTWKGHRGLFVRGELTDRRDADRRILILPTPRHSIWLSCDLSISLQRQMPDFFDKVEAGFHWDDPDVAR